MKKIILRFFYLISRVLFPLVPRELYRKHLTLEEKLKNDLVEETFKHFKEHLKKSMLFKDVGQLREYAIKTALNDGFNKNYYFLEFGVWKGESANYFSNYCDKLYCFDSFEGLKEDWTGTFMPKGSFNLNKKLPKLNDNIEVIVGWVEDTLDDFLKKHNPKIKFVHLDMDTYSPTKFVLKKIKPYLVKDAIIVFDEFYNYIGWQNGEYKALKEIFKETEFEYKAFIINNNSQAVIKII